MALLLQELSAGADWLDRALTLNGLVSAAELWLILTVLLLIAEIFTFGFFLAAIAVSTLLTALFAWGGASGGVQLTVLSISTIASMVWLRPVFLRLLAPDDTATNTDALVGSVGTVTHQVSADGAGRVRLSNEEWRATASESLPVGAAVRVEAVRGNTLVVRSAEPRDSA